jgi:hypothetical protein
LDITKDREGMAGPELTIFAKEICEIPRFSEAKTPESPSELTIQQKSFAGHPSSE